MRMKKWERFSFPLSIFSFPLGVKNDRRKKCRKYRKSLEIVRNS